MRAMKKYLATYIWPTAEADKGKYGPEFGQTMLQAWAKWAKENASAIIDPGTPVGKPKRVSANGASDAENGMCVFSIVQADSIEAAAKIFEKHPHIALLPGTYVDVMEYLPGHPLP